MRSPSLHPLKGEPGTPQRAEHIDGIIKTNRDKTPQTDLDKRTKPRLSIAETNQMDGDEFVDRFLKTGPLDDRTPVQKVLDAIDLPRNTNANILFGHPTASGIATSVGAGGVIGGIIGGIGGAVTGGLASGGPGALPGAIAGAQWGAATGAALTGGSHVVAGLAGSMVDKDSRDAITKNKETSALGQPGIHVSDALKQLGVNNRIINSVVGFAGDVLMDPLTYAGGEGFGLEAGGQTFRAGLKGVLNRSAEESATGGIKAISDDAIRNVMLKAGKYAPDAVLKPEELKNVILGSPKKGLVTKTFNALGENAPHAGGLVETYGRTAKTAANTEAHEAIDSIHNLSMKYGRGTGPSLGVGFQDGATKIGSQVMHIPFGGLGPIPSYTVQVPGWTATGRRTLSQFETARDAIAGGLAEITKPIEDTHAAVASMQARSTAFEDANQNHLENIADLQDQIKASPGERNAQLETQLQAAKDAHAKHLEDYVTGIASDHSRLTQAIDALKNEPATAANANTLMYLGEQRRAADALIARAAANKDAADAAVKAVAVVRGLQGNPIRKASETLKRLATLDAGQMIGANAADAKGLPVNVGDIVHMADRSDHPSIGESGAMVEKIVRDNRGDLHAVVGPGKEDVIPVSDLEVTTARPSYEKGNLGLSIEDQAKADSIRSMIRSIESPAHDITPIPPYADHPTPLNSEDPTFDFRARLGDRDNATLNRLYTELEKIERPYRPQGVGQSTSGVDAVAGTYRGRGNLAINANGEVHINADPAVQNRVFEAIRPILDSIEQDSKELATLQKSAKSTDLGDVFEFAQPLAGETQTATDIARIQDLKDTLAARRKELHEATAPLREGPHQTLDEFNDVMRERAAAQVNENTRQLWELHNADPKGAEALADAYGKLFTAHNNYRDVIGGNIAKHASKSDWGALELARSMLGTADYQVAANTIGQAAAGMDASINTTPNPIRRGLEAINRSVAPLMGTRYGEGGAELAALKGAKAMSGTEGTRWAWQNVYLPLKAAIDKAGLANHAEDIHSLFTMMQQYTAGETGKLALMIPDANGTLQPTKLQSSMNTLMQMLRDKGPDTAEQLFKDMQEVVGTSNARLKAVYAQKVAAGVRDAAKEMEEYTPHVLSKQGAKQVGRFKKEAGYLAKNPTERTTGAYIFDDVRPGREGKHEMFTDMDRWVQNAAETDPLKLTDPQAWNEAMETKAKIERYDRLVNKPARQQLDIQTLNDMASDGKLGRLSMPKGQDLFETKWPLIMAKTLASHERSMATQNALAMLSKIGLPIDAGKLNELAGKAAQAGGEVVLPTGEKATVKMVRAGIGGGELPVLYARGQTYRALDKTLSQHADSTIGKMFATAMGDKVYPEWAANAAEDITRAWSDEKIVQNLSALDKATSIYKSMTLFHPSWFLNNLVGHMTMLATGDVNPKAWAESIPDAIKIFRFRNSPEELAKIKVNVRGEIMDGNEIVRHANNHSTFGSGQHSEMLEQMAADTTTTPPSKLASMGFTEGLKQDYEARARLGMLGKPGAVLGVMGDRFKRHALEPFFGANDFAQSSARLAGALALMKSGNDAPTAFDTVRRVMHDFHDFTGFEQNVAKKMIPFYSWAKSNLSYQVRLLFQHPQYMALFPKLQNGLEEALDGEQRVPMGSRPQWMRQALAIQIGNAGYMPLTSIPTLEALQAVQGATGGEGLMEAVKYGTGYLSPAATIPASLAAKKDLFSGRSIGSPETGGDMTMGDFVSGQVRPLAEFGPNGRLWQAFNRGGPVAGAERFLAGGRVQPMDDATLKRQSGRDVRAQIENARKSYSLAESRKDHAQSLRMRVRLLKLYQHAQEQGLEGEVPIPKWAKTSLAGMSNG